MPNESINGALFIHALTGLHPGTGTALGVVDLPVQRERHTQWPIIPGSAVKGVMRNMCRERSGGGSNDDWLAVFGPEVIKEDGNSYAGAVSFTDARLLAFPVRSLKGVFAWITCPAVLMRLKRDLALTGVDLTLPIPELKKGQVAGKTGSPLYVDMENGGQKVILEEIDFDVNTDAGGGQVAATLASRAASDEDTAKRMKAHTLVLHDDAFGHFVQHATEVTARIRIEYETKSVAKGALFYEEFLPPETIMYSLAFATDSRKKNDAGTKKMTADQVFKYIADAVAKKPYLQFGADATIGKGICAVKFESAGRKEG